MKKTAVLNAIRALLIFLTVLWIGFPGSFCSATVDSFSDTFESYSTGRLNGQGSWIDNIADKATVNTTKANTGSKSVRIKYQYNPPDGAIAWETLTATSTIGTVYLNVNFGDYENHYDAGSYILLQLFLNANDTPTSTYIARLNIIQENNTTYHVDYYDRTGSHTLVDSGTIGDGWHTIAIHYDESDDKLQYIFDGTGSGEVDSMPVGGGASIKTISFHNTGLQYTYIDDISHYTTAPDDILINYPVDESISMAEYWQVTASTATTTFDQIDLVIRYSATSTCADSACDGSWYDIKTVTDCDSATSTYSGSTVISLLDHELLDGITYYARPYIVGYTAEECTQQIPNEVIIVEGDTIHFEKTSNYLSGLTDFDQWIIDTWGATTSASIGNSKAGSGIIDFIDSIAEPILNSMAAFSNYFNTDVADDYGVSAGVAVATLFQKIADFLSIIPGIQLLLIVYIAITIQCGIWIFKLLYRVFQIIRG